MPIALVFIGVVILVVAIRGTEKEFFALLKSDFTGPGNFIYWVLAFYLIGAVGYFPPLRKLSNTFLVLVILALFLSNRGFFVKFTDALKGNGGSDFGGISGSIGKTIGNAIGGAVKDKVGTTLNDAIGNITKSVGSILP